MKKMALFVEGLTEQIFAQRLIEQIAGRHRLSTLLLKATGGANCQRRFSRVEANSPTGACFQILICDCSSDTSVLSDIRDQYETLVQQGYVRVLGLRDVYPKPSIDAPKIQAAIAPYLPVGVVPVQMLLAIAEIEAWFLAEDTHYERIDVALTSEVVTEVLGQPANQIVAESIPHPADTLDQIYQMAGKRYTKDRRRIARTIQELDCAALYLQVSQRVTALGSLCQEIDQFLG